MPTSTTYGPWRVKREKQKGVIRFTIVRYVKLWNGHESTQRLSVKKYRDIRENEEELEKLCARLNYDLNKEKQAKEKVAFKHAFIDDGLLEEFRALLTSQIPTEDKVSTNMYYLEHYFLSYFIQTLNLANPREWYDVHQTKWAAFLKTGKVRDKKGALKDVPSAASSKRDIVQIANRFMKWLHGKRPTEVPLYVFSPLSKAVMKMIDAERKMNDEATHRRNIPDADWKKIRAKLPDGLKSMALLAYHYGLRRAEVLGLQPADVRNGHIAAVRQLKRLTPEVTYKPLKGREARKIPHWFGSAIEAHRWICDACEKRIHPDTLSDRWLEFMQSMGMDYDFHDLRHTFITRALNHHMPKVVMFAAGHKDVSTTMGYTHDDRDLDDEQFNPGAA